MGFQEPCVTSDSKENFNELLSKFHTIVKNNAITRTSVDSVNGKLVKTTEQEELQCHPVALITLKNKTAKLTGRSGIKEYPVGTQFVLVQGERWQQRTPVSLLGDSLDSRLGSKWIPIDITFTEEMCPEDKIWGNLMAISEVDEVSENDYIKIQAFDKVKINVD